MSAQQASRPKKTPCKRSASPAGTAPKTKGKRPVTPVASAITTLQTEGDSVNSNASSPAAPSESNTENKIQYVFKDPNFVHSTKAAGNKRIRIWKNLKQICAADRGLTWNDNDVTYSSIDAPPSFSPAKKYSDITGLPELDTHKFVSLSWKESGRKHTGLVPTNWVRVEEDFTLLWWPNKVKVNWDIQQRTPPTTQWQMFMVEKIHHFHDKWRTNMDLSNLHEGFDDDDETATDNDELDDEIDSHLDVKPDPDENINEDDIELSDLSTSSDAGTAAEQLGNGWPTLDISMLHEAPAFDEDNEGASDDTEILYEDDSRLDVVKPDPDESVDKADRSGQHDEDNQDPDVQQPPAKKCRCVNCPDHETNQSTSFEKLASHLNRKVDKMENTLKEFMSAFKNHTFREKQDSGGEALNFIPEPMDTREQVETLEDAITGKPDLLQALVTYLSKIGGETPSKLAANIMARLMKPTASRHYNIRGNGTKASFKSYRLYHVVFEAVRARYENFEEFHIHHVIKTYLRQSQSKINRKAVRDEVRQLKQARFRGPLK